MNATITKGIATLAIGGAILFGATLKTENIDPVIVNGQEIQFPYTDDNTGEDIIIRTDKDVYNSWDKADVYFALKNNSGSDQNLKVRFLFGKNETSDIYELIKNVPYEVEVDVLGRKETSCKSLRKSQGYYSCDGKLMACDTAVNNMCVRNEAPIATTTEIRYRDMWVKVNEIEAITKKDTYNQNRLSKFVPTNYEAKEEGTLFIANGETKYLKAELKFNPSKRENTEFHIEATGQDAYGILDPWYNASWTYRKSITIDYTKVSTATSNETYANFPILVDNTDSDLKHTDHSGFVGKTDGTDILFTASDGTTKLPHDLERYASTTGRIVAWVKLPTQLSSTTNTTIYMYFGNSGASDQTDRTNVWYNYLMVQHMEENPGTTCSGTSEFCDSSWNNYHGDQVGTMTSADQVEGKIGYGTDFDGSNDQARWTDNSALDGISKLYLSAWAKQSSQGTNDLVISKYLGGSAIGWTMQTATASCGDSDDVYVAQDTTGYGCTSGNILSTSAYSKWDMSYDGTQTGNSNRMKFYHNGSNQSLTFSGTIPATVSGYTNRLHVSGSDDAIFMFPGIIDEVRVSTSTRSASWILTEYNNQNATSTFYSFGTKETDVVAGYGESLEFISEY